MVVEDKQMVMLFVNILVPMGTNCAPLVAGLFLYCYERDFMLSLKSDTQSDIIEAFNNTSRYLDDNFNIDNPFLILCFPLYTQKSCVQIKQTSQLFWHLFGLRSFHKQRDYFVQIYDKRDDFYFAIVNYANLDGHDPRATSYVTGFTYYNLSVSLFLCRKFQRP